MMHSDSASRKELEKHSSAFTLSDMEIFIFPELFYPLVLANIMSPVIWQWRDDPWFRDMGKKNFSYKVNRIKQYIIDHYVFNLDLATWGLTTKTAEVERFRDFFDMDMLRQSNALFGYEGDKYYFDIDIRKHFGLDKFDSDVIPYWKTETIEAMGAFRHKDGFTTGAGECVSLSALYASAMFVVGQIPLEKIFLIATPLHSQNFITEKEGIITNNRRIVTKNMWFNGTSLSEKARRALENERVTIVSHITGHIHTLFNEATIDKEAYTEFSTKLKEFLAADLSNHIFINFLRFKSRYKTLFQYVFDEAGSKRFILLERMFEYEHSSRFNVFESREQLLKEIDGDDFHLSPIQGKIVLNDLEKVLEKSKGKSLETLEKEFISVVNTHEYEIIREMFGEIRDFIITVPDIPDKHKEFSVTDHLTISPEDTREKIITKINKLARKSEMAKLAQYVYRDMDQIDWIPFIKAAIERNPVCFTGLEGKSPDEVYENIKSISDESIYEQHRLALPDEVWNFGQGDGIEKALLMADFIVHTGSSEEISIDISPKRVILQHDGKNYQFHTRKQFNKKIIIKERNYFVSSL